MRPKRLEKSQYKGVFKIRNNGKEMWLLDVMINGNRYESKHHTEREAALTYDLAQIRHGNKPQNILKKHENK